MCLFGEPKFAGFTEEKPHEEKWQPSIFAISELKLLLNNLVCRNGRFRHSIGDTDVFFSLQSCSKPLTYVIGLNELGHNIVHEYIGHEPSGQQFNHIKLNDDSKSTVNT